MRNDMDQRIDKFISLFIETPLLFGHPAITDEFIEWLIHNNYFNAASDNRQYEGGLFDHSIAVTEQIIQFTKEYNLKWQKARSPFIIGMFHDLTCCSKYMNVGDKYIRNPAAHRGIHGCSSEEILQTFITLTDEESSCIRNHEALSTSDINSQYVDSFENLLWVHTAELYVTGVIERENKSGKGCQ